MVTDEWIAGVQAELRPDKNPESRTRLYSCDLLNLVDEVARLRAENARYRTAIEDHRHNTRTAVYTEQEHINRVLWEALEESVDAQA